MQYRRLGKTGYEISAIGFGAWAIGGSWGQVDDPTSMRALHAAADAGVTLYDTADVYGDGHSEQLIGRFLRERSGERLIVATKMGRRVPQVTANYTPEHFAEWTARSRDNLGVDRLDLVQLHCPPTDLFYHPEVFAACDDLVASGAMAHYGVSVERVEEGLKALEFPGVASVQIIFNIVRQRPADRFLAEAASRDVGVLARVPMASGLLDGQAERVQHVRGGRPPQLQPARRVVRHGRDVLGPRLRHRARGRGAAPPARSGGRNDGAARARWILMFEQVTASIPGARTPEQAVSNAAAADLPPLSKDTMRQVREVYDELAKPLVHQRW